jgi:hypothetical protein
MAHKRPPLELNELTHTLKTSKGQGADAFFSSSPPLPSPTIQEKQSDHHRVSPSVNERSTESIQHSNTSNNNESTLATNIVSNITILQITDQDIEALRELAEKPQTYRLTHQNIEYVKDMAYTLSKESKRGKIGQGDILRIALVLFDKFVTSNKADLQAILERIK